MDKYLYGASVQGIQDFIFATNKLTEIVGASELVEQITNTDFLKEFNLQKQPKKILQAAGNIKLIFDNKEDLAKVVREFPKFAMLKAYGITISQAVVKFEKLNKYVMNELEAKLKEERNRNYLPLDMGFNIVSLAPATAKPAVKKEKRGEKEEFIDKSSLQKRRVAENSKRVSDKMEIDSIYKKIEEISNSKNKIAVIHADGNGLGKIIQGIGENLSKHPEKIEKAYKNFSQILDEATTISVKNAYKKTKEKYPNLKIRPIVLGGDDLTMITDANSALYFVNEYLKEFEKNTKEGFKEFVNEFEIKDFKGLTACAGIAFCNEKYPFHYAVDLAEELCVTTKNITERKKSSVMFHNIQSSYFSSFEDFKENELIIKNEKREIELSYGPYFINDNPKIEDFLNLSKSLFQKGSPLAKLRNWLSELHNNDDYAQILLNRIDEMADDNQEYKKELLEKLKKLDERLALKNLIVDNKTPIYDVLQLHAVVDEKRDKK